MRRRRRALGQAEEPTSSKTHFSSSSCLLSRSTFTSSSSLFRKMQSASCKRGDTSSPGAQSAEPRRRRGQRQEHGNASQWSAGAGRCETVSQGAPVAPGGEWNVPLRITGVSLFLTWDIAPNSKLTNEHSNYIF